jgi:dihydroorotate dehydrogenase (NAD+) catalytic subunit
VLVHLAATTAPEVGLGMELLERAQGVSGVELGVRDDVSTGELRGLVRAAVGALPLLVRLPVARASDLAEAAAAAGADALVVAAPPRGSVEVDGRTVTGRIYGPGCFGAALEAVRAVAARDLGLAIIGAGGIFSVDHARAMLEAGAAAIQFDAAVWIQPRLAARLLEALSAPG